MPRIGVFLAIRFWLSSFFAPIAKQMGDRIDRVGEFLYGNQSCEESQKNPDNVLSIRVVLAN